MTDMNLLVASVKIAMVEIEHLDTVAQSLGHPFSDEREAFWAAIVRDAYNRMIEIQDTKRAQK